MKSISQATILAPDHLERQEEAVPDISLIRRRVLRLSWPVVAELALQTLTQVVDLAMVTRLGPAAVAAVALGFQPVWILLGLMMGLAVGTTALVARYEGAGDRREGVRVTGQSMLMAGVLGTLASVITWLGAGRIMIWMGAAPEVVAPGRTYLAWLAPGLLFTFLNVTITAALRGAGDTLTPMKVNLALNLVNLVGDYALIFGHVGFPRLEVAGAAIATTLARVVGAALLVWFLFSRRSRLPLSSGDFWPPRPALLQRVVAVGYPASLERLIITTGQAVYTRMVATLGTVALAAHAISINVESLSFMPGLAVATAATTLVGQCLGANRPDEAARSGWESWKVGVAIMGLMGVAFFLFPAALVRVFFTREPQIVAYGVTTLRIVAFAQIPMATAFVISGALRGAGDTRYILYITIFSVWTIRLAATYLLVVQWKTGLAGAWLAMSADWVVRAILATARFRRGRWKLLRV